MTEDEKEREAKKAYAALLLRERDPFKAALALFPDDTNKALKVANFWPKDLEVTQETKRIEKDEGDSLLLSKAAFLQDIELRMAETSVPDEYVKLAKLYAEARGFIEKPQTNVNVTNNVPRVVEFPAFSSGDDWEKAAAKQQRELLDNARTRH